jgi:hypothetical protein
MYNLAVANDHTYAVGDSQAVVHNDDVCGPEGLQGMKDKVRAAQNGYRKASKGSIAGGVVIRDTDTGEVLFEGGPYEGRNVLGIPNGALHNEQQSFVNAG